MFAIELYRKYLYNSTKGISNKEKTTKLIFEKQKISNILNALDNLFYQDKAIMDRDDTSIYTFIKRDIISDVAQRGKDVVICETRFFIQSILNEIEIMRQAMVA